MPYGRMLTIRPLIQCLRALLVHPDVESFGGKGKVRTHGDREEVNFHAVLILHHPGTTTTRHCSRSLRSKVCTAKVFRLFQVVNPCVNRVTLNPNGPCLETLYLKRRSISPTTGVLYLWV